MKPADFPIHIDYDRSIVSLSSSILAHFGIKPSSATLPELDAVLKKNYTNVVLLIIDGMGSEILRQNLRGNSFICQHKKCDISSVFPPTTAAATTAYHSGLTPWQSGWLGWMCYFPQYKRIIASFRNEDYYSGEKLSTPSPADSLIKYTSIYEQIIRHNPMVEYHRVFPPFDKNGVQSFSELCQRVGKICRSDKCKKIISAYWTEPDHSIHDYGTTAPQVKKILHDINADLRKLFASLHNTVVIISADHGAMDIEDVLLNDYADISQTFLLPPTFEGRFVSFFIKPQEKQNFARLFEQYFGTDFVLFTKKEFLRSGILGEGKPHPQVVLSTGDFVAIGVKNKMLKYTTGEKAVRNFIGDHSGYTKAEMTVPLILLEKS